MKTCSDQIILGRRAASLLLAPLLIWSSTIVLRAEDARPGPDFTAKLHSDQIGSPTPVTDPSLSVIIYGTDYHERLRTVHALGTDLTTGQLKALVSFIQALPEPAEKNRPALCLLKNDTLNLIQSQTSPPRNLTASIIEIYQNQYQDEVLRDYALQHLVTWAEQHQGLTAVERASIQEILYEAAQSNSSLAGTALLGLHRLAGLDARFMGKDIKSLAGRLAASDDTEAATRITAVQVCAELGGSVEILPVIKSLAASATSVPLQAAAIAALGDLGSAGDIGALAHLKNPSPALHPAIASALKRLRQRFPQQELARTNNER